MIEKRNREFIEKPIFCGAPISFARQYFRTRFSKFRNEHPQFNEFLIGLNIKLKEEKGDQFNNIIKLIDGEGDTNWISPKKCMFDALIKIYNYCFSPSQALTYIKRCYRLYMFMLNSDYQIDTIHDFSLRRSKWDSKARKFVEVIVEPIFPPKDIDDTFWFNVTTSSLFVSGLSILSPDITIQLGKGKDIINDALSLFDYYQDELLSKKIIKTVIDGLVEKDVFINEKTYEHSGCLCHEYEVIGEIGKS